MITAPTGTEAADHGDTPVIIDGAVRHDARITDLYAFTRADNLVLVLGTNPTVPNGVTSYLFPSDVDFVIGIDNSSFVSPDEPSDTGTFGPLGGTVEAPGSIDDDVKIQVNFDPSGNATVRLNGSTGGAGDIHPEVTFFADDRDDPFIRTPRTGKNVGAIVIEIPLDSVLDEQDTILVWAYAKVSDAAEEDADLEFAGRALRNQFPENACINTRKKPKHHLSRCGLLPDVIIFDTSVPAAFPNGRELTDDVIDLVGDPRPLGNEDPDNDENDVPFLATFPYLAAPH